MKKKIITGLDIGSTTIRLVAGQLNSEGRLHIIGGAEHPAEGISKGTIISVEDAVASISKCLDKAERMIGFPIEHAFVGISGTHIISQESKGIIAVSRADGEIRESDVQRAIEAAQTVATPLNYEILHVIPKSFIVDDQIGIKDPIGMTGVRLEVEAKIIEGLSVQIRNLNKCVLRAGLDIDELVFSILASSDLVANKRQKDLGVAVVNIGGNTTSVAVFEEGDLLLSKVLPIGSAHITNDIAIGLRVSIDLAEKIKLTYGSALPKEVSKKEMIDLSELDESENESVPKKNIAEFIEARTEEIFRMVDKELKEIGKSGKLPAGVILTGGGAKLNGLVEVAKKEFRLPVSLGYPQNIVAVIDKISDSGFTSALGLVLWGSQRESGQDKFLSSLFHLPTLIRKLKDWIKSLIP